MQEAAFNQTDPLLRETRPPRGTRCAHRSTTLYIVAEFPHLSAGSHLFVSAFPLTPPSPTPSGRKRVPDPADETRCIDLGPPARRSWAEYPHTATRRSSRGWSPRMEWPL